MYTTLASASLLGFLAVASAAPYGSGYQPWRSGSSASTSSAASPYSTSGAQADAFAFPLSNGFPNVTNPSSQLTQIEQQAHGTLPNGSAPPPPHADSLNSLGFIAFNELMEVAFFTELIANITANAPGYDNIHNRSQVLAILNAVQAQEELHELNANGAFAKFSGGSVITPCEYVFPVDNFNDAIALASKFTDVVLGTLPDIQTIFGTDGDVGLIRGVGAVIGQEGEQNGFYRDLLGKTPSALPFLTASARDFAFNAINQNFVVPGSCDASLDLLLHPATGTPLIEFGVLNVLTDPNDITSEMDSMVQFSFSTSMTNVPGGSSVAQSFAVQSPSTSGLFVTYVNQQNKPFSVPLLNEQFTDGAVTFEASFPGQSQEMNGLTIAALTNSTGPFATVDDVAAATLFGPGLIEIN